MSPRERRTTNWARTGRPVIVSTSAHPCCGNSRKGENGDRRTTDMDVSPLSSRIAPLRRQNEEETCVLSIGRSIERTQSRRYGPCKLVFRRGSRVVSEGCDVGQRPGGAVSTNHSFAGVPQWWRVVSVKIFVGHKTLFISVSPVTNISISFASSLRFTASHIFFCSRPSYHLVAARQSLITNMVSFFRSLIFAKARIARMSKSFLCVFSFFFSNSN